MAYSPVCEEKDFHEPLQLDHLSKIALQSVWLIEWSGIGKAGSHRYMEVCL